MTNKIPKPTPEEIETRKIMDRIAHNIEEISKISNATTDELSKLADEINYHLVLSNISNIDKMCSKNHDICSELDQSANRTECFDYVLDFNHKIENAIINALKLRIM